jgi:hypothetical protein
MTVPRFRTYNPGRDTRWGTAHGRKTQPLPGWDALGRAQQQADQSTRETTGKPLPWKRWPDPLHRMPQYQVEEAVRLVREAPELNQLRRIGGEVYWCLRVPEWFLDWQPAHANLPGEPIEQPIPPPVAAPLPDLRGPDRARLLDALTGAGRAGHLQDEELRLAAAEVGFALMDMYRPIGDALRLRLPDPAEHIRRVAAVAPPIGELLSYV